ncbi:glucuronate isomerase [Halanaerobium saccharolyticum]|uniref:Uronate isomerase n=1 Tax=Halanaerobium saccharolyticum TaxID=43595 RepID=A0A4V3G610_9FIRM|nr:glucuronate isomerase [Halanaerobium saccharolyticum]RAK12509.1 glucuronate isomerase [Halanaerobium saccharolyticum]TDW06435.1 glucuronate isomerase [Halanaerobium saccharolyticum]TDX61683.1 glucuronate isomerase [Halanaerobium saccharolyticum]
MGFLDSNYLFENDSARYLYNSIKDLPIVDAHNHADLKEILNNENWHDIWELEAASDHYVWELMRKRGVPEEKITGKASNKEKWMALAKIFPEIAGNPTYEWIHLDLKRVLGIEENISENTAEKIWAKSKRILAEPEFKPQKLLQQMNVEIMCTTDNVFSLLKEHQQIRKQLERPLILPTWRTDTVMNLEEPEWLESVEQLGENYEEDISNLKGFMRALQKSHDHFEKLGCVAGDHGFFEPISYPVEFNQAEEIYVSALSGVSLSKDEIKDFKAFLLMEIGKMNQKSDWVTQFHIGTVRGYREYLNQNETQGDGGDISTYKLEIAKNIKYFLNHFDSQLDIVLYSMEPTHWFTLSTISRAFPNVYLGAAWWFSDSPHGMEKQLQQISTVDLYYNFAGMVTDSRKISSYSSRTEMFRRSLANVIGRALERGQIPRITAFNLVGWVSYYGPKELFFEKISKI